MRAAILSDIHANLPALESVLEAVDAAGVEEIWCLGDVVGYGADPDACAELVRERCDICLVGNHDLAVLGSIDASSFSDTAAVGVVWTQENAAATTLTFLHGLEPSAEREGIGLFHASPRNPVWEYVLSLDQAEAGLDALEQQIGLIGHSHIPLFFARPERGRPDGVHGRHADQGTSFGLGADKWLLNPGSVGQPRDGDPRAAWLELDTEDLLVHFHRTGYDVDAAATSILAAGLPQALADRLKVGR